MMYVQRYQELRLLWPDILSPAKQLLRLQLDGRLADGTQYSTDADTLGARIDPALNILSH